MSSMGTSLSPAQIAAIAAVVSVVVLITIISIIVRYVIVRRREYDVEEIPKRELRVSPDSTISELSQAKQAKEIHTNKIRVSVADTGRSSIWGDTGQCIAPTPSNKGDVWDSRRWPLPPGHPERYTFFSERSSTSLDEIPEMRQLDIGNRDENRIAENHTAEETRKEPETRERCESVWGMPGIGIGIAH
ncbi:uncharacterized protein F4822DRAFT_423012 [Hypoxylon trugodes]|uniref:uncharacterized protein n=1 Tax=Hypoxylon trugodes TaxID=326681 RepID=UPI0021985CE0|nr:uncharacterized protein F4822DRAFT_423012 [Hypoxylon trugodes]KAI1382901.1 hypothetical protein F4822DRAFT_423012 [Hypoxylon trugodes]